MNKYVKIFQFSLLMLCVSVASHAQTPLELMVDEMLLKADGYLADDQLSTPENANALDYYRAVLILEKDNARAKAGLEAIARRYLEMATSSARAGSFVRAKAHVENAITVTGETQQTQQLLEAIRQAQLVARRARPVKPVPIIAEPDVSDNAQFELDKTLLTNRDQAMVVQLQSLGLRVLESREYVLIHARSDAEGRWIYQQMRNASKGYRLRGDIRRSQTPKVILQEPLD